mmetsp:Transcript_29611/g.33929  ORF Transcript_29611/g.33929 Transcript_29611/m.33929 type:complete len:160 (+) Transcript_29611:3-482(+)
MEKADLSKEKDQKKKVKKQKLINFEEYGTKKLAFKFSYIGFNYQGLTIQKHTDNTVEFHIFNALKKLRLVQGESPGEWGFSRCGRTDKGVSALGNVFAVTVRNLTKRVQPKQATVHGRKDENKTDSQQPPNIDIEETKEEKKDSELEIKKHPADVELYA